MKEIHILHVSDLHYEESAKAKHIQIARALVEDVKRIRTNHGVSPDMVIFSGDLVNRGSEGKDAYRGVSTHYVEPLLSAIGLTQERFFCVPGNHDIDRDRSFKEFENGLEFELSSSDSLNAYYNACAKSQDRYAPLRPKLQEYFEFEKSYDGESLTYRDDFVGVDILNIGEMKIGVARFNSAWRSSGFGTDQGRLLIASDVIDNSVEMLKGSHLKIAIGHHPIGWLAEWNEREVQNRLAKNFNFFFCGHLHNSNAALFQQILGGVYISSAGCLKSGKLSNYSIVSVNIADDSVTTRFRKWYPDREEFDQETEKAPNGTVIFEGVQLQDEKVKERLRFADYRAALREQLRSDKVVNPLEGIVDLDVNDVFIEPLIRDASVHNREEEKPAVFDFEKLVAEERNLFFYGGKEAGKSTLLLRINELELRAKTNSDTVEIPIRISFFKFSKHNVEGLIKELRRAIGGAIEGQDLQRFLDDGLVVLLVDDLGDHNDPDRNRKLDVFIEFYQKYPRVRVIATILENVRPFACERLDSLKDMMSAGVYYLWPFTASRLRQLLVKIGGYKAKVSGASIDVDRLLDQIVYYFKNLQIPITPLAATLFIGVLFRDIKQKDIQNEAYLIENYSRDILEKLGADTAKSGDLEYPDKIAFLAHIAARMHDSLDFDWSLEDFESESVAYFKTWGEKAPNKTVFQQFFDKGILDLYAGRVSFKFKFWFNFFLAKAMARKTSESARVVNRKDYLRFRVAISYKAGLLRNDVELLEEISQRLINAGTKFGDGTQPFAGVLDISTQVSEMTPLLEGEIRQKNSEAEVDVVKQSELTVVVSDDEQDEELNIVDLLTLHSEIIKHTREVDEARKIELIRLNVKGYIGLMYIFNETFAELVGKMSLEELAKYLFPKESSKTGERRINAMLRNGRRMIWRIVPTSVALYLADHLAANRMAPNLIAASGVEGISDFERTMYLILAFRADMSKGLDALEVALHKGLNPMSEFVIQAFVQIVAQESRMSKDQIDRVVALLSQMGNKYLPSNNGRKNEGVIGPNIRDQIKNQLRLNSEEK